MVKITNHFNRIQLIDWYSCLFALFCCYYTPSLSTGVATLKNKHLHSRPLIRPRNSKSHRYRKGHSEKTGKKHTQTVCFCKSEERKDLIMRFKFVSQPWIWIHCTGETSGEPEASFIFV